MTVQAKRSGRTTTATATSTTTASHITIAPSCRHRHLATSRRCSKPGGARAWASPAWRHDTARRGPMPLVGIPDAFESSRFRDDAFQVAGTHRGEQVHASSDDVIHVGSGGQWRVEPSTMGSTTRRQSAGACAIVDELDRRGRTRARSPAAIGRRGRCARAWPKSLRAAPAARNSRRNGRSGGGAIGTPRLCEQTSAPRVAAGTAASSAAPPNAVIGMSSGGSCR